MYSRKPKKRVKDVVLGETITRVKKDSEKPRLVRVVKVHEVIEFLEHLAFHDGNANDTSVASDAHWLRNLADCLESMANRGEPLDTLWVEGVIPRLRDVSNTLDSVELE